MKRIFLFLICFIFMQGCYEKFYCYDFKFQDNVKIKCGMWKDSIGLILDESPIEKRYIVYVRDSLQPIKVFDCDCLELIK